MLPDNVTVDCGPYGKCYPTWDQIQRLSESAVPPEELGTLASPHRARDYARNECYERETHP